MNDTGVNSRISYESSIWVYRNVKPGQKIQEYGFLGAFTPIQAEMGQKSGKFQHYFLYLETSEQVSKMQNDRLSKKVAEFQIIDRNNFCVWISCIIFLYDILDQYEA